VGQDTLTDAARIVSLHPEPDGQTVAVLFADSIRGVMAGLGIHRERAGPTQLLWPDSVTRLWWSGDHTLSFTTLTGEGVYVVVDVHDQSAEAVQQLGQTPPPTVDDTTDRVLLGRAQVYVDSIRTQPTGVSQGGAMTYTVTTYLADPTGRFGAFRATAGDTLGRELNPTWYVTHVESGEVVLIDEIVGLASELPRDAAGWTDDGRFVYAKGSVLHEVSLETGPSHSP
jgi:hypothetical protein